MPNFDAYTAHQRKVLNELHRECVYDAEQGLTGALPQLPPGITVDALSLRYASLVRERLTSAMRWLSDLTKARSRWAIVRCELGYYICVYEFRRTDCDFSLYFDGRRDGICGSRGMIGCRIKYQSPWHDTGITVGWNEVDIDY